MDKKITSKFIIVSNDNIRTIGSLVRDIAHEKFSNIVSPEALRKYMEDTLNDERIIHETDMVNQMLVVCVDDNPIGYTRITTKGKKPDIPGCKKIVRIADFGILSKYDDPLVRQSLVDKCLSVSKWDDAVWLNEYIGNPLIDFFESNHFIKLKQIPEQYELPLPSVYLSREKVK